jgi:hypothetical protein
MLYPDMELLLHGSTVLERTLGVSHTGGFSSRNLVGLFWTSDQPSQRPVPTRQQDAERRGHTSMPYAGFEPTIITPMRSSLRFRMIRCSDPVWAYVLRYESSSLVNPDDNYI